MKRTLLPIIALSALLFAVLPYIVAPLVHNHKLRRFDVGIRAIPAPEGYEKIAQEHWFGQLWACGNHADYLVIAVFRGADDDALVHGYFNRDFGVYCPEAESDAVPFIYKRRGGTWQYVVQDNSADDFRPYLDSLALECDEPLYYIVYAAQGKADFDFRTH